MKNICLLFDEQPDQEAFFHFSLAAHLFLTGTRLMNHKLTVKRRSLGVSLRLEEKPSIPA